MSLWPFRKRRKTKPSDGKKVVIEEPAIERIPSIPISVASRKLSARQKSRRNASRRAPAGALKNREVAFASSVAPVATFPLTPNRSSSPTPMETEFRPQKQQREGGFASYFVEQNASLSDSSTSSHRPHKPSSVFRRFSKRQPTDRTQPPPSAYATQLARAYSKRGKRVRNFDTSDFEQRPMSSVSVADSTLSSQSSARAFKIRSLDVFSPRPTLVYDELLHVCAQNPSQANSRAGQDSRHDRRISEEQLAGSTRVDELANELDARGLREAMERDRRRRERRKQDAAEKLQRRLDRRAQKQKAAEEREFDFDLDMDINFDDAYPSPDIQMGESSNSAPAYSGRYVEPFPPQRGRQDSATMGTQTPLSWLNDASAEDVNKGPSNYSPRPEVVTPVSMASNEQEETFVDVKEQPSRHSLSPKLSLHSMNRSIPEEINESEDPASMRTPGVPQTILETTEEGVGRAKTSAWTSFIKRATAARIKKEQASRAIRAGESTLVSDSEGEHEEYTTPYTRPKGKFREIEELRHVQGQTPGRHIPDEVAFAMTALETGHIRGKDDVPDERLNPYMSPPPGGYGHSGSQSSSKSSLPPHLSGRHMPRSGSSRYAAPSPQNIEAQQDSPTIPQHPRTSSQQSLYAYPRPTSNQRYSPSLQRRSSGAGSPGDRPKSLMSQSLASIDSEGSWLSGKINPRGSIHQMSPLRTSASSLRKRYKEFDDGNSLEEDEYFSGVDKKKGKEEELEGVKTYTSEVDDSEDDASVDSVAEKNVWREGFAKKVVVHDAEKMRPKSKEGLLRDFEDPTSPTDAIVKELPRQGSSPLGPKGQIEEQMKEQTELLQIQQRTEQQMQRETDDPRKTSELLDKVELPEGK